MSKHLQRDIDGLINRLLTISSMVEEMIDRATLALSERRYDLAAQVISSDDFVDTSEVRLEEECLKMLALHQPVAVDLRRIATVLKVNADLERMADLAVSIANRARAISEFPAFVVPDRLAKMVVLATQMVRGAMDSFVNLDAAAARRILAVDHTASTIARPHYAAIDDLTSGDTLVCEPAPCAAPPADDVAAWETEIETLPNGPVMSDDDDEEEETSGGGGGAAGDVDDFDEDDFDDEFDDDFEEELEDEYDLADLEEVSDDDLTAAEVEIPIGGDFVDEDEEPEEPVLPVDPDAPTAAEEEKPKKGKGKAKGKGKKAKDDDDDEDDDLDLDDDE